MHIQLITSMTSTEAKKFLMKEESYIDFKLPPYFKFSDVLEFVDKKLKESKLSDFYKQDKSETNPEKTKPVKPFHFDNVNHTIYMNKDGKYGWRPIQIIHPAIYVELVNKITEEINWSQIMKKFDEYQMMSEIECYSIPLESKVEDKSDVEMSINRWWLGMEQNSFKYALDYEYMICADITDCYGSIYTHTIVWALHTKKTAKKTRGRNELLGNFIDGSISDMNCGQTNGIPQGSVLMDFIAEMVLGYADTQLYEKIRETNIENYKILRYRDDYRIFSINHEDAELIAKLLSEILTELGLKLNTHKTKLSSSIIIDSIKTDKVYWMNTVRYSKNLQKQLLIIHKLAELYPNSGSLMKVLGEYYHRIKKIDKYKGDVIVLISILVDIMYKNTKTYGIATAILSKMLDWLYAVNASECLEIVEKVANKFKKIPNSGYLDLWMQRITIKIKKDISYHEPLCKFVGEEFIPLWNSDWLQDVIRDEINGIAIIDKEVLETLSQVIEYQEVSTFNYDDGFEAMDGYEDVNFEDIKEIEANDLITS